MTYEDTYPVRVRVDPAGYRAHYGHDAAHPEDIGRRALDALIAALPAHNRAFLTITREASERELREGATEAIVEACRAAAVDAEARYGDGTRLAAIALRASDYEDGYWLSGSTAVGYATDGIPEPVDLTASRIDGELSDYAGRVDPDALLVVDLATGEIEYDAYGGDLARRWDKPSTASKEVHRVVEEVYVPRITDLEWAGLVSADGIPYRPRVPREWVQATDPTSRFGVLARHAWNLADAHHRHGQGIFGRHRRAAHVLQTLDPAGADPSTGPVRGHRPRPLDSGRSSAAGFGLGPFHPHRKGHR